MVRALTSQQSAAAWAVAAVTRSSYGRLVALLAALSRDIASAEDALADVPDRRLELMLACAHPAIDPAVRTPLMLQTVLGVDSATIAKAFAVTPAAMAQRLVRAKRRIRAAGIPFVVPRWEDLAERLPAVLEAVYGAYAIDWDTNPDPAPAEA